MPETLQASGASNAAVIKRLLWLCWQYRRGCIKVLLLQFFLLAFGLFALGFSGLGIDQIRHFAQPEIPAPHWPLGLAPPETWSPMAVIGLIAGLVMGSALLRAVLNFFYHVEVNQLVQAEIVVQLRDALYDKMQRLSFRFFDANASSSIINRITGDVQALRAFVDQVVLQMLIMVLSLGVFLVYMLNIHVGLTLACLSSTPLLWFASARFSGIVGPAFVRNRELIDRMIARFAENFRGIQVVKAFGREPFEIAAFERSAREVMTQQFWVFRKVSLFVPLTGVISQINLVVLLLFGGWLVLHGKIPLGTGLVVFAGILNQFSGQISNIGQIANTMQQSLAGARRVFEVVDAPVAIESAPDAVKPARISGEIAFENVWFAHEHDPVLEEVTLRVRPGERIGIIGPTGSGKSALTGLIPRFYDPTGGRITLDGIDLRALDLHTLRRNVGLVFQESFLFSTTIAANIAFGHPHATDAQIESAARVAAAHDFISELPLGYETVLGEGGIGLSGGQRQRLAIARAVLLEPAILLLDDPTAAVDPGTESEIARALVSAMAGRTTFLVTGRLSMLRHCDRVIVLERGRITQAGPLAELAEAPGFLRRLQRAQGGWSGETEDAA